MRVKEIIPESWWEDLDPGFLSMMGYGEETQEESLETNLAAQVARDAREVREG